MKTLILFKFPHMIFPNSNGCYQNKSSLYAELSKTEPTLTSKTRNSPSMVTALLTIFHKDRLTTVNTAMLETNVTPF